MEGILAFEPTGATPESLLGNSDALRLPISIEIGRRRPLTTRMWEQLFREMEDAALSTDMRLYEQAMANSAVVRDREGFDYIRRQTDRFVITSIDRSSIVVAAAVLLAAAGWIYKKFIEPGWEKSESKKHWDDSVASVIDKAVPILKEQIDIRVVHRLKRLNIRRVSLRPPSGRGIRLSDNSTPETELIYDKPKQIVHYPKK
jgi:hypothetical protein